MAVAVAVVLAFGAVFWERRVGFPIGMGQLLVL